jgi:hypothetical protein
MGGMSLKVKVHNPCRVQIKSISRVPDHGQIESLDMECMEESHHRF